MQWWAIATLVGGAGVALAAVWTDVKRREIPHWIAVALLVLWAQAAFLVPEVLNARPVAGLACGAVGLACGFALHALGWLGGGDGKLLAVLAMWIGPADLALALLGTGIIGLVLTAAALVPVAPGWRRRSIPFALAIVPPAVTILAARTISHLH